VAADSAAVVVVERTSAVAADTAAADTANPVHEDKQQRLPSGSRRFFGLSL